MINTYIPNTLSTKYKDFTGKLQIPQKCRLDTKFIMSSRATKKEKKNEKNK